MTKIKIFGKLEAILQKKFQKFLHNTNNIKKLIISEILISQSNDVIPKDKNENYLTIIIKLNLHNSSFQNVIIKDFFTLSLHLISKAESLLRRTFLYLLKYIILITKTYLYLSQFKKKLITITFILNHVRV